MMHARVEEVRESVPEKEARDVGVTKAALLVFNNFVAQIVPNAPTPETMKSCTPQLRQSKRLSQHVEVVVSIAPPLAAPLQPKVRAPSSFLFFTLIRIGACFGERRPIIGPGNLRS